MLKSVNTLGAIFLTAGLAQAGINVTEPAAQDLSCSEAREAAWFLHELARTDGNVDPVGPYVPCDADRQNFDGVMQPVVYRPDGINATGQAAEGPSCKEARETAWFLNELSRTDGNTNPEVPYIACGTDGQHFAEFGLDAD
jgi:hypothetical protein